MNGGNYYAALGMEVARNDGNDYSKAASSSLNSASDSLHNIFNDTDKAFETGKKSVDDLFGILGTPAYEDKDGNKIGATGWLGVSEQLAKEEGLENKQKNEQKQYNNELLSLSQKKDELFNLMNNKIETIKDKEKTDLVQKTTGFNSSQDYERNMDIFIADKFSKYNLSKDDLVRMSRFPDTIAIEALKRGINPKDLFDDFNKYKDIISTYSGIKLKEDDINNNIFSQESNRELANDLYQYSKYLYPNKTSQQIYDELNNSQLKNKEDIAKTRYSILNNNLSTALGETGIHPEFWVNNNVQNKEPSNDNPKVSKNIQTSQTASNQKIEQDSLNDNPIVKQAQEEFEQEVYQNNPKLVNPNGKATQFSIGKEQTDMNNYKDVITPSILEFNKQTNQIADYQAAIDTLGVGFGLTRGGFSWSVKNGEIIATAFDGKKTAIKTTYDLAKQDGKGTVGALMSAGKEFRHKFLTGTKAQREEIVTKINEALPENTRKNLVEFATKHYGKAALSVVGTYTLVNNIDAITDYFEQAGISEKNEINKELNKDTEVNKSNAINTVKKVNDYYMTENDGRSLFGFGKYKQGSHLIFDVFDANPTINPNVYNELRNKNSKFVDFFGETDFDKVEQDLLYIIDNDSYIMGKEYYQVMLDKISIAKNIQNRLKYLETYQKQYNSFNPNSQEYKGINKDITIKQIEGQNLKATDINNKELIQKNKTDLEGLNYKQESQKIASINSIVGDNKVDKINPTMKSSYELLTGKTDIDLNKNKKINLKYTKENQEEINKNNFIPKINLDIPMAIFFEKSIHKDADSVEIFNQLINDKKYKKLVYEFTARQSTNPSSRATANFESEIGQLIIKKAEELGINLRSKSGNNKESGPISTGKTLFAISDRNKFKFADFIVDVSKAGRLTQKQFELLMGKYSR